MTMTTVARRGLSREALTRFRMVFGRLGRMLRQRPDEDLPYALTSLLFSIDRFEPTTAGDLAAAEGVTPPAITRSLNRLRELGLISREPHPEDGRATVIRLTTRGRAERRRLRQRRDAWLGAQLRRMPAEDLSRLLEALPILERLAGPE